MAQKKKTEPVEKIQEEPQKVVPERDDCKITDYTKWQREYIDRMDQQRFSYQQPSDCRTDVLPVKKCLCIQTGLPPSHAGLNIFRLFRLWQYKIRHIPDHAV